MDKKILIIFLLTISLFLAACEVEDTPPDYQVPPTEDEIPPTEAECKTDNDCVTGGCSGTLCQSKDAEPLMTTCEWREEYACYKQTSCSCINEKCQWKETQEFKTCLESKSSLSAVIT